MKSILPITMLLVCYALPAQQDRSLVKSYPGLVSKAEFLGNIPALRDLAPKTDLGYKLPAKPFQKRQYFKGNPSHNPHPQPDNGDPLLAELKPTDRTEGPPLVEEWNLEGLRDPHGAYPPDANGDIGKNHYVQMVNSAEGAWFQVWDKKTGASVYGPALTNTIWSQVQSTSYGDPVIQYDHQAERWLMMELKDINDFGLLLAISDGSDPTGPWKAYHLQSLGFPDYPKLFIWHDAYFFTVNEIVQSNVCSGYAIDRAALLAGNPDFSIVRFTMPNFQAIQFQPATGADWEGGAPPPPGSPGYIFRIYDDAWDGGQDHLETWEVHTNWQNPGLSHIDGPALLVPAPFETRVCYGEAFSFDCLEQPDPDAGRLEALETNIMHRAPYRNFGDHETVVLNHLTDVSGIVGDGGDAAVRWYELQKTGNEQWHIAQQGTYAPDLSTNRFMSTISIDEAENIGLGYSGVSEALYPGLYLTGRQKNDPPGEMTAPEFALAEGESSFTLNRWGDYSSMTVDPYDGRTFWFTGEYMPANGKNWATRIGAFRVRRDTFDVSPNQLLAPQSSPFLGSNEAIKVEISNEGLQNADHIFISLWVDQQFITEDAIAAAIPAGGAFNYTFSKPANLSQVGKTYHIRAITRWTKDQFVRNDTLDAFVQKLYANNVALTQLLHLPGVVCGTEADFSILLRNASGANLNSAKLQWRVNNQAWQQYNWSGVLPPGAIDTIPVHIGGLQDGNNNVQVACSMPNGNQDEFTADDQLNRTVIGNAVGSPLFVHVVSSAGTLHWELRTLNSVVVDQGDVTRETEDFQICAENQKCYVLVLRAKSFEWQGKLELTDLFGNVLLTVFSASQDDEAHGLCTPMRRQKDLGATGLIAPVSGPNLGSNEPVTLQFRNFGLTTQNSVQVAYKLNNGPWHNETAQGIFAPGQTYTHTFTGVENLAVAGSKYKFRLSATIPDDEQTFNDQVEVLVSNKFVRDLELVEIYNESACNDSASAFFILRIRNNGLDDKHDFQIQYSLNGVPQQAVSVHSFMAAPDEVAEFPILVKNMKTGLNTLSCDITNVDGQGEDENPSNDSDEISFEIDPGKTQVAMIFIADSHPAETTWDIQDDQGNVLYSGGPYNEVNEFISRYLCLDLNACYVFNLYDAGGNGCDGYIALSIDQFILFEFSGLNFGSTYAIPFCTDALCADLTLTAQLTQPSSASAQDGKIVVQASGGTPPYFFILNGGDLQQSPVFDHLGIGNYELICLDGLGCTKDLHLDLGISDLDDPVAGAHGKAVATPNPTRGITHLEWPADEKTDSGTGVLYDGLGRKIQSFRLSAWSGVLHGKLALDQLPAGCYFAQLSNGKKQTVVRIVKE